MLYLLLRLLTKGIAIIVEVEAREGVAEEDCAGCSDDAAEDCEGRCKSHRERRVWDEGGMLGPWMRRVLVRELAESFSPGVEEDDLRESESKNE